MVSGFHFNSFSLFFWYFQHYDASKQDKFILLMGWWCELRARARSTYAKKLMVIISFFNLNTLTVRFHCLNQFSMIEMVTHKALDQHTLFSSSCALIFASSFSNRRWIQRKYHVIMFRSKLTSRLKHIVTLA